MRTLTSSSSGGECRNPSIWLVTKARGLRGCGPRSRPGSHITCSRECKHSGECEGMNPHTPKWTPTLGVGENEVPKGLPKLQRAFWGVKTPWLVALFISMESSWSVDVQNGLALLIWTSETQVVAKRKPGSRTPGSPPVLTPDQWKSRIDPKYLGAENVRHTVRKVSTRPTTLLQTATRSEVFSESYKDSKSRESKVARFRDSHAGVPGKKSHLDAGSAASCRVYYKGEGGGFPQGRAVVSQSESEFTRGCPNTKRTRNEF
jgi:hypothetical protein